MLIGNQMIFKNVETIHEMEQMQVHHNDHLENCISLEEI